MKFTLFKISSILFILLFCTPAFASKTALIYHSNYQDTHTNVKDQLEADGYTVTLSTTGSVHENLFTNDIDGTSGGYDVVFDLKYNNSIGSNGKARYNAFVQAGGVLILVGENSNFSNNNNTIRAFVQNNLGGSLTFQGNTTGCARPCSSPVNSNTINTTNTSIVDSNYGSFGIYPYGQHFTGDGTWVAKNASGQIVWMRWSGSELPSGYSGAVYVTFDINQFETAFDGTHFDSYISDLYSNFLTAVVSAITSSQQTEVTTARNKSVSGNQIYINQSGDGIDLDILQDGDDNLIIGSDLSSTAQITGDSITLNVTQNNNDNVLGIDISGNSNSATIVQDTDQRAIVNINGASNTITLDQDHLNNQGTHYSNVKIVGNSNTVDIDQTETGNKVLFLDIDNSNNVSVDQKGTGAHFLDIDLTDSHTVDVTQDGSGSHSATINLSGNSSSVTLTQDSSTNQNYYIEQNCASTSCSATVTQN